MVKKGVSFWLVNWDAEFLSCVVLSLWRHCVAVLWVYSGGARSMAGAVLQVTLEWQLVRQNEGVLILTS